MVNRDFPMIKSNIFKVYKYFKLLNLAIFICIVGNSYYSITNLIIRLLFPSSVSFSRYIPAGK